MDNPPAFPVADVRTHDGMGLREGSDGMSLRDWFAGQAFGAVMGTAQGFGSMSDEEIGRQLKEAAAFIYRAADAMLAERAKEIK